MVSNLAIQCCRAGAVNFWSEPVWRSGSGSTLAKTEEILNDILSIRQLKNGPAAQHWLAWS